MDNRIPQYYKYIILFKGAVDDIEPILRVSNLSELTSLREKYIGNMHLFDANLIPILPAIKYCLHLPRLELDVCDIDTQLLDKAYDESQDILIIPDKGYLQLELPFQPAIIIFAEECCEEAKQKAIKSKTMLGAISIERLTSKLLVKHWNTLYEKRCLKNDKKVPDIEKQYLLDDQHIIALPILFMARQYGDIDNVLMNIYRSEDIFKTCAEILWSQWVRQKAILNSSDCVDLHKSKFADRYKIEFEKAQRNTMFNLVITMPGITKKQQKLCCLSNELPENEGKVIKLLGLHRAIAKNALLLELPIIQKDLFDKLNELEINCITETNNKYVHNTLRNLGKILESKLSKEQIWAINWAKQITVFSDFPVGLAVFGNADTPLQCYKEISYLPLTPLTRCLQTETLKHPQLYYGKHCKVAFAECVINNDENKVVRKWSEGIVYHLKNLEKKNAGFEFSYKETLTITGLKEFIKENIDADILHISAHGYYERDQNMAGLMVGNEFWMADDNDIRVPQVVILSACHVSPRGSGTVNVADLFMRAGAEAVLGTFIPVSAKRNTILITRLYTYIAEAQTGSTQYKNLSEAWSGVVSTNAVHEIAETNERFFKWIWGKNDKGKIRMVEFQLERSVGKLHGRTMYSDTIKIIKEMLQEEGMDGKFADILEQENYFPESFFYQWIGFPENIFLYNEVFEKVQDEYG